MRAYPRFLSAIERTEHLAVQLSDLVLFSLEWILDNSKARYDLNFRAYFGRSIPHDPIGTFFTFQLLFVRLFPP